MEKAGADLFIEEGEEMPFYTKAGQVSHHFLQHALEIADFRLNMELATKDHPIVELKRFIADFEIKTHTKEAIGKKIYKLFDEVTHPVNKQRYVVYPDMLFILQGKQQYKDFQRLYFVEIDRGTESLNTIRQKLVGYNLYLKQKIFTKFGKVETFRLLIQTNSPIRAENIRKSFVDMEGERLAWVTDKTKVNEATILNAPIWQDYEGTQQSILKI